MRRHLHTTSSMKIGWVGIDDAGDCQAWKGVSWSCKSASVAPGQRKGRRGVEQAILPVERRFDSGGRTPIDLQMLHKDWSLCKWIVYMANNEASVEQEVERQLNPIACSHCRQRKRKVRSHPLVAILGKRGRLLLNWVHASAIDSCKCFRYPYERLSC